MEKQMSILNQLACAKGRRDEVPNQELAASLAKSKDKAAVRELVAAITHKDKNIASDSVKVVYEIANLEPSLITDYSKELISLLKSKNNRIQWGAMMALSAIASLIPDKIYKALPEIMHAAEKGSVITRDHYVNILIALGQLKKYGQHMAPLLNEQLLKSPENQLPMYAERALEMITADNSKLFIKTLESRLASLEKDTRKKRIEKVIGRLKKL
jgi:hypothetical protein